MNTNMWCLIRNISSAVLCIGSLAACEGVEDPADNADLVSVDQDASGRRAKSNLQVMVDGVWRGVGCVNGVPALTVSAITWTEYDRTLTDETVGLKLKCPEGDPSGCWCDETGERMHGINGWDLDASLKADGGGPVYPDQLLATCVYVGADNLLETDWTSDSCPFFRFR